jgi:ribosome-binding protein aMBF1 (putative translation factor)
MAGAAAAVIERQPAFIQSVDDEVIQIRFPREAQESIDVEQLRAIADEIRSYTERIEKAIAGEQLFWTEEQLAEKFKCSVISIKRERRAGKIPFKRTPGGDVVFTKAHIEQYLAS